MSLTTLRKKELNKIISANPKFECQGVVGQFLDVYLVSEVLIRRLIHYYVKDTSKIETKTFNIKQLKLALAHFDIPFIESKINLLFGGGEGKRGEKTARQLRNGYIHSLSTMDYDEILKKSNIFIPLLEDFSKKICI